jgi:hypothetical protein
MITTEPRVATEPPSRPRRRGPWIALALLTALAVVVPTVTGLTGKLIRRTFEQTQTYSYAAKTLEVDSGAAAVTVTGGGPPGKITVVQSLHWALNKPQVKLDPVGDSFRVWVVCNDGASPFAVLDCGADIQVKVPSGVTVRTKSTSGSTDIRGITGGVHAKAASGELNLRDVGGPIEASVASGSIEGRGLWSSQVDVASRSGEIDLAFSQAPAKVDARARSGSVLIRVPAGSHYRVRTNTGSGNVELARGIDDGPAQGEISAYTGSGPVEITYP